MTTCSPSSRGRSGPAGCPQTLSGLLERRQHDPRAALIEGATGRSVTWADVAGVAAALRARRPELTTDPQRPLGLHLSDPVMMASSFVGALVAGIGAAPLNPAATPAELVSRCRAVGTAVVVTDSPDARFVDAFTSAGSEVWAIGTSSMAPGLASSGVPTAADDGLRAVAADRLPAVVAPERAWLLERRSSRCACEPPLPPGGAALVLASSGTTAKPKIIPLSEQQLIGAAAGVAHHHELSALDRGYCPLPLFHINGLVVGVLSALVAGSSLVVDRRFSRRRFWSVVEDQEVTWLNLVPAIIGALGGADAHPRGVRFARSASAPLAATALHRFEDRCGIPVIETYGMTEAASQITANPMSLHERRPGSAGRSVDVDVRVVGAGRRPVAPGVVGDVEIRGDNVADFYWSPAGEQPAIVAATATDGWLATGDAGHLDADGFLYLAGRRDDMINRGGEKIYPREIEDVLLGDPRVVAAVVIGRPHDTMGEEPVAFVLTASGAPDPAGLVDDLDRRCRATLSGHKCPVGITVTNALPVGPTGKVRRRELRSEAVKMASPAPAGLTASSPVAAARFGLELPERPSKPRSVGLTMVIDNGLPCGYFADAMASAAAHIDIVKFGWGTALVTIDLEAKIACCRRHGIRFCFGGTLFEKFVVQDRFPGFLAMCRHHACDLVEVSNGTIALINTDKASYIRACAGEFEVISEVGVKDAVRSEALCASDWARAVDEDLVAGSSLVITEARESGRSGICQRDGTLRLDVVEEILASGVDPDLLVFEAPTKELAVQFISRLGPTVNLGNVAAGDAIGVETLRLGLRSDTLLATEDLLGTQASLRGGASLPAAAPRPCRPGPGAASSRTEAVHA